MKNKFDRGIDVSHWKGNIDWAKVKQSDINFAIAKVTGGSQFQDPKFLVNWQGMKNNGIKASAYHYFQGNHTAESQIINIKESLLAKCDFDVSNDILVIDVEEGLNETVGPEEMADNLWSLLSGLKITFNHIYIYCSSNYWDNKIKWGKYDFSDYELWIAHWTDEEAPKIPTTWQDKGWVWWQYSSKGRIDGIKGDVDLDRNNLLGILEEEQYVT